MACAQRHQGTAKQRQVGCDAGVVAPCRGVLALRARDVNFPLPKPSIGGRIGFELSRLVEAVNSLRPISTDDEFVSVTTLGTKRVKINTKTIPIPRQVWFVVMEIFEDFLVCRPIDGRMWYNEFGNPPTQYFLVAKPFSLRTGWLLGGSGDQNGFTFEKYEPETTQRRFIKHDGHDPERDLEEIYPLYSVGSLILATEVFDTMPGVWNTIDTISTIPESIGLVTSEEITPTNPLSGGAFPAGTVVEWLDLNIDARAWASQGLLTGDRAAVGDVTINVSGTPYTDENSLRVAGYET